MSTAETGLLPAVVQAVAEVLVTKAPAALRQIKVVSRAEKSPARSAAEGVVVLASEMPRLMRRTYS